MREQDDQRRIRRNRFAQMSEDQMEEYFRNRYAEDLAAGNDSYFESIPQDLLPDASSPNLFIVKCHKAQEKSSCMHLVRKYLAYSQTDHPLEIQSAVYKEGLKGLIYVEAFKLKDVVKAVEGIRTLNSRQIRMVPKNELIDTLKVIKQPSAKARRLGMFWFHICLLIAAFSRSC